MAYGEEGRMKKEKATWGDIVEEKRRCSDGLWIVDNNEGSGEALDNEQTRQFLSVGRSNSRAGPKLFIVLCCFCLLGNNHKT